MSKNKLYHVIKSFISPAEVADTGVTLFKPSKNQQGAMYYLFELELIENMQVGDYTLNSHHLSAYETATSTSALDRKSQYHYTAYFSDAIGKNYRLHIFYDMHDNLLQQPLLSEILDDGSFRPVACEEEMNAFSLLSNISIKPLITKLRSVQKTETLKLQAEYNELEKQAAALADHLPKTKTEYLKLINDEISILDRIIHHTNNTKIDAEKKRYLLKLKSSLSAKEDAPKINKTKKAVKKSSIPATKITQTTATKSKATLSKDIEKRGDDLKKIPAVEIMPSPFQMAVKKINSDFELCKSFEENKFIAQINRLYTQSAEMECELMFGKNLVSAHDLPALRKISDKINNAGTDLLMRLLMGGKYEQAEKLVRFYSFLPSRFLYLPLTTNNTKLLHWLLSKNLLSVHEKDLSLRDMYFTSLIDYCFKMHTANFPKSDLLAMLIDKGASLLELDSQSGLPFAALLLQGMHPFNTNIDDIGGPLFSDPLFYQQLNKALIVLRQHPTCRPENIPVINKLIDQNAKKIISLQSDKLLKLGSTRKISNDVAVQARDLLGDDLVAQLLDDPQVISLKESVDSGLANLLPLLSVSNRNEIKSQLVLNLEAIKNGLNAIDDIGSLITFDELKVECLKQYRNSLQAIQLRTELAEIQNELAISNGRVMNFSSKNVRKEHQKLAAEEKRVIKELKMIAAELEQPFTFLKDYNQIKNSLSAAIHQLQSLDLELGRLQEALSFFSLFADKTKDQSPSNSLSHSPVSLIDSALTDADSDSEHDNNAGAAPASIVMKK